MAHDKRLSVVYDLKVTHFDAAEQALPVVDPVCALNVDPDHALARVQYRGPLFYFCSPACREVFDLSPEDYI